MVRPPRPARRLTHFIATNKPRTVETLRPLAIASGLGGDRDGDGPRRQRRGPAAGRGDQYPRTPWNATRLPADAGPEASIVDAIRALPAGSRAVVANHSDTLYAIITEATGIDTSDPVLFPKEDGSATGSATSTICGSSRSVLPARGRCSRTSSSTSRSSGSGTSSSSDDAQGCRPGDGAASPAARPGP